MHRLLKQKRDALKVLRAQKKELIADIRNKKTAKKDIEQQMAKLRLDIKTIKGQNLEW